MSKFLLAKKKFKKMCSFKVDILVFCQLNIFTTIVFYVLMYCLSTQFLLQLNDQYIFIHQYILNRTKENTRKKIINKIKQPTPPRKSANDSSLFKTQSHTIPEVLNSFGNSAYNIKKVKYKERL